ncbi:MAG: high-affinity nickel-transporter [Chloroflexi bacterium]|nr:high-affinity nickel-transporter [Chloroflexota bacterium]
MKKLRLFSVITLTLIAAHLFAPLAAAHPLGNFTINQYVGLQVSRQAITLDYVLDMAEIPTFQEIAGFDANQNGQADPTETDNYQLTQCQAIRADLDLRLNGQVAALNLESTALEFPPGAGGLPTLRLTCTFHAPLGVTAQNIQVQFKNNAYAERLGWREIVMTGDGVSLPDDLAPLSQSVSHRLAIYPNDLLSSPLNQREVSFMLVLNPTSGQQSAQLSDASAGQPAGQSLNPAVDRNDGFTRLITTENLSPITLLVALAISFVWGAAHALTPGHGKTIVAAYLVGSRGTTRHAFFLGLTTTVTHTAGVFILGFLTLFASQFILPERLYPWLGVASGLLVVSIGGSLFKERLRQFLGVGNTNHHHQAHPHLHDHSHGHGHGHTHSHMLPGGDGSPVTWRNLLALGVSGGLIPCPSALVVMLSAIALQRISFGLLLIVAFSLGLAGVLTTIGILWVHAGRLFGRVPASGRLIQILPALSALFISVIGLGITLQALAQTGALPAHVTTMITMVVTGVGIPF